MKSSSKLLVLPLLHKMGWRMERREGGRGWNWGKRKLLFESQQPRRLDRLCWDGLPDVQRPKTQINKMQILWWGVWGMKTSEKWNCNNEPNVAALSKIHNFRNWPLFNSWAGLWIGVTGRGIIFIVIQRFSTQSRNRQNVTYWSWQRRVSSIISHKMRGKVKLNYSSYG